MLILFLLCTRYVSAVVHRRDLQLKRNDVFCSRFVQYDVCAVELFGEHFDDCSAHTCRLFRAGGFRMPGSVILNGQRYGISIPVDDDCYCAFSNGVKIDYAIWRA